MRWVNPILAADRTKEVQLDVMTGQPIAAVTTRRLAENAGFELGQTDAGPGAAGPLLIAENKARRHHAAFSQSWLAALTWSFSAAGCLRLPR